MNARIATLALGVFSDTLFSCNYSSPESCPFYCWESFIDVDDIPEDAMRPGYFPTQCETPSSGSALAPLPTTGYPARECHPYVIPLGQRPDPAVNSAMHFLLESAISKLQASESPTTEEADAYDAWAAHIAGEAQETCISSLTCNWMPGTCDIDPTVAGDQSCTVASAASICDTNVENVLFGLLGRPSPSQYPECSGSDYVVVTDSLCEGYVPDLNGTGGYCADDGFIPGTGSTSMGSADTTGAKADPFGDLDSLIACDGNDCDLDVALIVNMMEHFGEFYDDDVSLAFVNDAACGYGVEIGGLSTGTPPAELANEFGAENGDIISSVNGLVISSEEHAATALEDLGSNTDFTVVVKRPDAMSCTTTTWTLEIVP